MRRHRQARLQEQLESQDLDGLLLLTSSAVAYATGASTPGADSGRSALFRPLVVVRRGDEVPHLFTPFPEGVPDEMPPDHVHPGLYPDLDDSCAELTTAVRGLLDGGGRIGADDLTYPVLGAAGGLELVSAAAALGPAKVCKSPDELACIRTAQQINERAMPTIQSMLLPGVRQNELSAAFLRRIFDLGAGSNGIDPIWQPMPSSRGEGPWTVHGDIAFPTASTDQLLREGDVVWVDTGIAYEGYASDFGRTWIVGHDPLPNARQRSQYERWRGVVDAVLEVCKPGATGLDLSRAAVAANGGTKPWIQHFYLAHGVGTDSAEMPLIGTDLGESFDEALVLAPGMVLVLEPVIWDEGCAGYRSEDMVAVTDDGWVSLSDYPYDPFDGPG
ncbi:MAG: M24 family metallopeptidase [Acidimicrobiales bacterium]